MRVTMKKLLPLCGAALLFSTTALAGSVSVKELPDQGSVVLNGTVDSVANEREFTLRDQTGTVTIEIASAESVVLKKGDTVTVTGTVDKGMMGTDIKASDVDVHKGFVESIGTAVKATPGIPVSGTTEMKIGELPKSGMVKVSGTVDGVESEKKFTLHDETGSINVDVKSAESAAVTKGAHVTVIGYIDDGLLAKDINATQVMVTADATPTAN